MQAQRKCDECGARLASDQRGPLCSPCTHARVQRDEPPVTSAEFWQLPAVADALTAQHFGRFFRAYRTAHEPHVTQAELGRWLGMTQAQVSRLERAKESPSDLRKLQRWASVLRVPPDLLWFAPHAPDESDDTTEIATLEDVRRRDMLRLTGAAVVATSGVLNDAPWQRLADSLSGNRAADPSTVTMIESRTAGFFRSEETLPARQLVLSLKAHHNALRDLINKTSNESLRRRLITAAGETQALTGWTLFDLQRPRDAVRLYEDALVTAEEAGDNALAACVLGYWSYLLSAQGDGKGAVKMLDDASGRIRGAAAATQA